MKLLKKSYVYFAIGIILFFLLTMILWSLINQWPWPNLWPKQFDLRGLKFAFGSMKSYRILLSSIGLSGFVTVLTLLICYPAARALAFYDFKGKKLISFLFLLPLIVPMITVVLGIHINFIKLGLANNITGVVLVHLLPGIPYGVRLMETSFRQIGQSIELQAQVLGAKRWQVFWYITLPLLFPGIIMAGTMIYIISFSQYFITFLIGGGKVMTFSLFIFPFIIIYIYF